MNRALISIAALAATTFVATAASAQPVISFNADWTVTQSAPLVAGQTAIFRYNLDRLPNCRAYSHGLPAWAILASYRADTSSVVGGAPITTGNVPGNPIDVAFTVPYGADFSVWFLNSDANGCSAWDSSFGQNYHFAIQGPPTVHFKSDWTNPVVGTLRSGAAIAIDYDLARLPSCRYSSKGFQAWDVTVFYRFDGGQVYNASLTQVVDMYNRKQAPAVINAPAGAHNVELWFQNNDGYGCMEYDSHFGQNYSFSLASP